MGSILTIFFGSAEKSETNNIKVLEKIKAHCKKKNILGKGGFGTVYQGYFQGQTVAIKRIKLKNKSYSSEIEKENLLFLQQNVINYLKVAYDKTHRYLVMELAAGTMADLLKKDDDLNPKRRECERILKQLPDLEVLTQIARGLCVLHSLQLVHGDIKPENILITKDERRNTLKLSDLGLTKEVSYHGNIVQFPLPSDGEERDDFCGMQSLKKDFSLEGLFTVSTIRGMSPAWTSPELIELNKFTMKDLMAAKAIGEPIRCSTASDIFSYGLVAFFYLTRGIHPFGYPYLTDEILLTIVPNIKNNNPINFESIDLPVGDPIRDLVLKTLEHDPKSRPSSSRLLASLNSVEVSEQKTKKATRAVDISHWDYLINNNLEVWDFSQVWEIYTSTSPPSPSFSPVSGVMKNERDSSPSKTSSLLFTDRTINKFSVIRHPSMLRQFFNFNFNFFLEYYWNGRRESFSDEESVRNALNVHFKTHEREERSGPHILLGFASGDESQLTDQHSDIPKVVGLLLPISDLRQIKNASILKLNHHDISSSNEEREEMTNGQSHLYYLLFNSYSRANLDKVIKFFGKNALRPTGSGFTSYSIDSSSILGDSVKNPPFTNAMLDYGSVFKDWDTFQILCSCYSAGENLKDLLTFLIKHCGINPLSKQVKGRDNALHMLCSYYRGRNLKEMVTFLIDECKVNPKEKTNDGWNALLLLCRHYLGDDLKDIMDILIDSGGINPNDMTEEGSDAFLFLCCRYRGKSLNECLISLIDRGVDPSKHRNPHRDSLPSVCSNYHGEDLKEVIDLILSKGHDVNAIDPETGFNSLHAVCSLYSGNNLKEVVSFLLEKKINVNAEDKSGQNALHLLCLHYNGDDFDDVVTLLCSGPNGILVNELTRDGSDAFLKRSMNYRFRYKYSKNLKISCRSLKQDFETLLNLGANTGKCYTTPPANVMKLLTLNHHRNDFGEILDLLYEKGFIIATNMDKMVKYECRILSHVCKNYRGSQLLEIVSRLVKEISKKSNHEATNDRTKLFKIHVMISLTFLHWLNLDLNRREVIDYLKEVYQQLRTDNDSEYDSYLSKALLL